MILELLNQSFNDFLAVRVFFWHGCVRYTRNSAINVTATNFLVLNLLAFFEVSSKCERQVSPVFHALCALVDFLASGLEGPDVHVANFGVSTTRSNLWD